MTETLIKTRKAAELLHVSTRTIWGYAHKGILRPVRKTPGGQRLYSLATVEELARSLEHEPGEEAS